MNNLAARLEKHSISEPNSGCLLWTASLTRNGYGQLRCGNAPKYAHRLAYEAANGPIPAGLHVCHKCDVPACINPDHLFLGTQADNMRDMRAKGRGRDPKSNLGEAHHSAKLTPGQVREIRLDKRKAKAVADAYGVHPSLVPLIRQGKIWKHVV